MSTLDGLSLEDHINRWESRASAKPASAKKSLAKKSPTKPAPAAKGPGGRKPITPGKAPGPDPARPVRVELAAMLRTAMQLEFATIPPYLCALWSIKDDLHPVAKSIREVVQEEMLHMGLTCNMLAAIGERPPILKLAPKYPGPLPGEIHPKLVVTLQGLNKDALLAFLQIESPEKLASSVPHEKDDPTWPPARTIGHFYECIHAAFQKYADEKGTFELGNQVSASLVWHVIASVNDVRKAIGIITSQGEGARTLKKGSSPQAKSPRDTSPRDSGREDYAHYYRFLEVWKEKRLVRLDKPRARTESYEWRAGYKLPECHPMGPVPEHGFQNTTDDVTQLLEDFDQTYHAMLTLLEAAWQPGGQGNLVHAIAKMFELQQYAKPLMEIKRTDDPNLTYGPRFTRPPVQETKKEHDP